MQTIYLSARKIFEQAIISRRLKDNLEAVFLFHSCRDQCITVGPVWGDLIIKVYQVLLKQYYDPGSRTGVFVLVK